MSDPQGRRLAVVYLTAQFQAAALAVLLLPLLPRLGVGVWPDPVLLTALGLAAAVCILVRTLVARGAIDPHGGAMTAGLLGLGVAVMAAVYATGGLLSPLILLAGALTVAAGMLLTPLANFFFLSGLCLLHTLVAMGGARQAAEPPFTLLVIEIGLLVLVGTAVNALAARLREQQDELARTDLRDPATGLLRGGVFRARMLSELERRDGVGLVLVETGPEAVDRTAATLTELVRGSDAVGRLGETRFAVLLAVASADQTLRVARRISSTLTTANAGWAFGSLESGHEAVDAARALFLDAEDCLASELAGYAA